MRVMFGKKMSGEYRTQRRAAKPQVADIALYCALFGSVFAFGFGPDFERAKQLCIASAAGLLVGCPTLDWHSRAMRAVFALAALLMLASVFALDPARAYFGSLERSQGLLGFLPLLVFAAARVDWRSLTRAVVLCVWPLALWAWAEQLAWSPFATGGLQRSYASLGNPNALAGWLVLALPICAAACRTGGQAWRAFSVGALVLAISALCLTESRAAALGLLAGILLCFCWHARPQHSLVLRRAALSAAFLGLALSGLISVRPDANAERLRLWESARSVLISPSPWLAEPNPTLRPWLGYGADHQAALLPAADGVIADRAHNLWLDALLQFGALASLALALLTALALRKCWQAPPSALSAARLVGLSAALITWQFGFPLSAELLLLTLLLSARKTAPKHSVRPEPVEGQQPTVQPERWRIPAAIFALGLALFAYAPWPRLPSVRTPERAYQQFIAGTQAYQRSDYRQAAAHFELAQKLDPLRADYRAARATAENMQFRKQAFPAPQNSARPIP